MLHRIDVYGKNPKFGKKNNKKLASHWYKTLDEANNAKFIIANMPRRVYTLQPGENREIKKVILGGYNVKGPFQDDRY